MRFQSSSLLVSWRFAVGQVLLTALGVALALAGSAWWTAHQERSREISDLHAALDATRTNEQRLRQAIYEDSLSFEYVVRVRDWLDHGAEIPTDSIKDLLVFSRWWSDAKPVTGIFTMIVQSGDINLVRDAKLRVLIPTYVGEIENRMGELEAIDNSQIEGGSLATALPIYRRFVGTPTASEASRLRESSDLYGIFEHQRFLMRNAIAFYRIMLRMTTELRLELERYLEEKPVTYPKPRLLRDSF